MALPELFLPSSLPDFKAGGHIAVPEPLYTPVERQGGDNRRRRVFTAVPRKLQAQLEVTQAQLEEFFVWHETSLQAGAVPFTAKVAKVGSGVEYWEAYCLAFSVEHEEGSMRTISLDLRLIGTPSADAPVASSLVAEFSAALVSLDLTEGYPFGLSAEAGADSYFYVETGAALSAEAVAALRVECSGAVTNPSLEFECEAYIGFYAVTGESPALAAEMSAGLDVLLAEDHPLAFETSAALDVAVEAVGVFSNPATVTVEDAGSPFKSTVKAAVWLYPDGTVYSRVRTGSLVYEGRYYSPLTPAVANGYFVRAVLVSGVSSDLVPATGVVQVFGPTSPLIWYVARDWNSPGVTAVTATIQIANDPDFLNIVSSFNIDLTAEYY